jgi:hypothetical protein
MALLKDNVTATAGGEERIPESGVNAWQAKVRRDLTEADRPHPALRVATDFGRGKVGVPQRDQAERDEAATGVPAPFLDHPVVVGADAR